MKRIHKSISGWAIAGLLILSVAGTASAQRGRGGFRGGIHIGMGGPRGGIGFGFGFRPHYFYPRVGVYLNTLPFGYYPFWWGPDQYYYYGGVFYRPYNNGYAVVAPPVGAAVPQLPPNTQPISIDGQQYYESSGVYYKEGSDDKGNKAYIVAGKDGVLNTDNGATDSTAVVPKVGDIVPQLPADCQAITLGGKKYYVSVDGTYYEQFTDKDKQKRYRVAGFADADPQASPQPQAPQNNKLQQQ